MFLTDFPLVLKKDTLNIFALALSYLHAEKQGRANLQGGKRLV